MKKQIEIINILDLRRVLFAVAMTAAACSSAFAAEIVTLKPEITLTANVLTLGDVFDGVTADAGHVLAPAPNFGKTLVLQNRDLTKISNAFNLGWEAPARPVQVVVRRNGNLVERGQIEAAVEQQLADKMPGQKLDVELNDRDATVYAAGKATDLHVSGLRYDMNRGEFRAAVSFGDGLVPKNISGRVHPVTEVPVLSKALRTGDVITASDIQYIDMRSSDLARNIIVDAEKMLGQTPRRGLPAMKPISSSELLMPTAVKKGDAVTMSLQSGVLQLTTSGRSIESGAVGEIVRVVNTSSNQVVEAVVTGPQTVTIRSPDAMLLGG